MWNFLRMLFPQIIKTWLLIYLSHSKSKLFLENKNNIFLFIKKILIGYIGDFYLKAFIKCIIFIINYSTIWIIIIDWSFWVETLKIKPLFLNIHNKYSNYMRLLNAFLFLLKNLSYVYLQVYLFNIISCLIIFYFIIFYKFF